MKVSGRLGSVAVNWPRRETALGGGIADRIFHRSNFGSTLSYSPIQSPIPPPEMPPLLLLLVLVVLVVVVSVVTALATARADRSIPFAH